MEEIKTPTHKTLKNIFGKKETQKNYRFEESVLRVLEFYVYDAASKEKVAIVTFKIYNQPVKHVVITNIKVLHSKNRGQSSPKETGIGGTIIRKINTELKNRGYFGVLLNQTKYLNRETPKVINFYEKHGWEYFDENISDYMYFASNKNLISKEDFENLENKYT